MHLYFSAGDPSGDQHVARLIEALRARAPELTCSGYGGPLMEQAGCQVDFRLTDMAFVGVREIAPLIGKYYGLYKQACRDMAERRPDAVVIVDYPGFNWWMAHAAKQNGIPVISYLPPQLWAWAPWRIFKMRRLVDHVLCCLPFEYEWYRQRRISAEFVGHPFFDEVAGQVLDADFLADRARERLSGKRLVGILPGSRNKEVRLNFPVQCQVMRRLLDTVPGCRFLVAAFKPHQRDWCAAHLQGIGGDLPVELCQGRTSEIIEAAEACLMASGSVSLELLARATPAVVQYRVDWMLYAGVRLMATCRWMTLPNLIAGRELMPEYLTVRERSPSNAEMARHLSTWLTRPEIHAEKVRELQELRDQVAVPGGIGRAADALLNRVSHARRRAA